MNFQLIFFLFLGVFFVFLTLYSEANNEVNERAERHRQFRARIRARDLERERLHQALQRGNGTHPDQATQKIETLRGIVESISQHGRVSTSMELPFARLFHTVWEQVEDEQHQQVFSELVLKILSLGECTLVESWDTLYGLHRLAALEQQFERPVDTLKFPTSDHWVFGSVVDHLLARYPVPVAFKRCFLDARATVGRQWFLDLAQGRSLRDSEGLPFPLTRTMIHHLHQAPEQLALFSALRWAQVRALGIKPELANWLAEGWLGNRPTANESFWESAFVFLVLHQEELSTARLDLLLAYLDFQRQLRQGFTFRGRSLSRLLERAETWWLRSGRTIPTHAQWWQSSGLKGYERVTSEGECWFVTELTNSAELSFEGERLNHCVGSYVEDCQDGSISIFSLRKRVPKVSDAKPIATLEVYLPTQTLTTALGNSNQEVDGVALEHIQSWADTANLTVALED